MKNAQIGLIGLGTMGAGLARNLGSKKITTVVYNRTEEKTKDFVKKFGNEYLSGETDLASFVKTLEAPRKILLMVQAGPAVDEIIGQLAPLLSKDDIIIDGGNSHYRDTERRASDLAKKGISFWGCGISGGEKGALEGPSLMPGGPKESWPKLQTIFTAIAAKDMKGKACVSYLGPAPAGHYVKMVHNGIEYGIMQAIAEAYEIMKTLLNMPTTTIGQVFDKFNRSKLNSYLCELTAIVLRQKDDLTKNSLIDNVLDKAAQKGTGSWTSEDALKRGIAIPTITEAVFSRCISAEKEQRQQLHKIYKHARKMENVDQDRFIDMLDDALFTAYISIFTQGFSLLQKASTEAKWDLDTAEVARIWQGGCIIRAKLLETIEEECRTRTKNAPQLFQKTKIADLLKGNSANLSGVVETALRNGIPAPALASALNYFYAMTQDRGNGNLIQGLRDAFGAHGYERIDRPGSFHTEW